VSGVVIIHKGTSDAERAKRLREELGIGLGEASRMIAKERLVQDIRSARSIDDIKSILLRIVK
jgi:hypothetical protein